MSNKMAEEYYGQKESVRLNKYISESGYCSRREADRLIEAGQVRIDGKTAVCGEKVFPGQRVTIGRKVIGQKDEMVVLAVNKPVGIICTEEKRIKNNIIRFLNYPVRVTYVGRLDKDSQGLLLMTNNGDIINKMMRAGNYHEKEYYVTVNKEVTFAFLEAMSAGVHIVDKEKNMDVVTRPCTVSKIGKYKFRIVLTQGLNRQIRRMCDALGYRVTELTRVRIMNIELGNLKPGEYRKLTYSELDELYELIRDSRNVGEEVSYEGCRKTGAGYEKGR